MHLDRLGYQVSRHRERWLPRLRIQHFWQLLLANLAQGHETLRPLVELIRRLEMRKLDQLATRLT